MYSWHFARSTKQNENFPMQTAKILIIIAHKSFIPYLKLKFTSERREKVSVKQQRQRERHTMWQLNLTAPLESLPCVSLSLSSSQSVSSTLLIIFKLIFSLHFIRITIDRGGSKEIFTSVFFLSLDFAAKKVILYFFNQLFLCILKTLFLNITNLLTVVN